MKKAIEIKSEDSNSIKKFQYEDGCYNIVEFTLAGEMINSIQLTQDELDKLFISMKEIDEY